MKKNAFPSLQESIVIGKQVLERKLEAYQHKLKRFENLMQMNTTTFTTLFNDGTLGDKKEYIEWEHIVHVVELLQKKLHDLEKLYQR